MSDDVNRMRGFLPTAATFEGRHMTSNDKLARLAGLLYLILLPTVGVALGSGPFLMAGNAAATLANIQAHRTFFELTIVLGAVGFIDYLVLALVLYWLFSPVRKAAASLLLAFVAAGVPLSLAAMAQRMDVLSLLDGAQGLPALGSEHWQVEAMLALHSSNNLMQVSAIFWGLWLIPLGWLVLRCGFMPRVLGVLLMLGSFFYVLTFAGPVFETNYASTLFARVVGILTGIPGVIGEIGTVFWLLIMGAREPKSAVRPAAPAV
jgi:Domain of unknown function (DUF4386)